MKTGFKPGDQRTYKKLVTRDDLVYFHGELLHPVCATFALARDIEWASRLFFIEMKEDDEEGVGTHLSIDHERPAFEGETLTIEATIDKINQNELICSILVRTERGVVARGKTGQKMLKKDKLKKLFSAS